MLQPKLPPILDIFIVFTDCIVPILSSALQRDLNTASTHRLFDEIISFSAQRAALFQRPEGRFRRRQRQEWQQPSSSRPLQPYCRAPIGLSNMHASIIPRPTFSRPSTWDANFPGQIEDRAGLFMLDIAMDLFQREKDPSAIPAIRERSDYNGTRLFPASENSQSAQGPGISEVSSFDLGLVFDVLTHKDTLIQGSGRLRELLSRETFDASSRIDLLSNIEPGKVMILQAPAHFLNTLPSTPSPQGPKGTLGQASRKVSKETKPCCTILPSPPEGGCAGVTKNGLFYTLLANSSSKTTADHANLPDDQPETFLAFMKCFAQSSNARLPPAAQ
ncbi:hypothetical protein J7T55_015484 [Diaporthe amygdali]|uniref:uncharacterized protein n=1 Tax=Phomopsis amygdali TaxID=1214568 RepID=UPI0022FEC8CC|nr:uncharacterized protein J7T55_015484 [Diaporthe amygdali]KAJ0120752.1 hypothetical protein J7T55_015484 [Diaporthe amygdali]